MIIDPRAGDAEDDASSTKKRSLIALAGSLLVEINFPRLILAWLMLVALPGILLGLAPLVITAWISGISVRLAAIGSIGSVLLLLLLAAIGWYGIRPFLRFAERSFWSLNSLLVQTSYALCREGLRQLTERFLPVEGDEDVRARLRGATAIAAGIISFIIGAVVVMIAWPYTRWTGLTEDLADPLRLVVPALANTVVLLAGYASVVSLIWGVADGTMAQPRGLAAFDPPPAGGRKWRVAHVSDVHVVGEHWGFRLESGRAGPRGNERYHLALEELAKVHAADPVDIVLISGDMTDAGRSSEWAEFFLTLQMHPELAARSFVLPGNHDLNIVDRANPARLELPFSPAKRLREMRALSANDAVQGTRVHVMNADRTAIGPTLTAALDPHRAAIRSFADSGAFRPSLDLEGVWADTFPMVLLPEDDEGLGMVILNSNAETHFSFTNALGYVAEEDLRSTLSVLHLYPRARWIVALHHHPVEYPMRAKKFSIRIGTALINGSRFIRALEPMAERLVVMHGHRHKDWIGRCGKLKVISAPSAVMEATDQQPTWFYVHTLAAAPDGSLALLQPQRIDLLPKDAATTGQRPASTSPTP